MMTYHSKENNNPTAVRITPEIEKSVMKLFLSKENNTVPRIAKELNLSHSVVNRVINAYFKK